MQVCFPNYIYSEIIKLSVMNKPIINDNEKFDHNYNDIRIKYILSLALVCKKWFKYCSICKFKLNCREIYEYIFKQPTLLLPINYTREITFNIDNIINSSSSSSSNTNHNSHIITPPQFSLIDFNNITMINLYNIDRNIMKILFKESSAFYIEKIFKNLEFIVDDINTLVENDLYSILSQYEYINNNRINGTGTGPIKLILNLYTSCSFSFNENDILKISMYNNLKVSILKITTDHMNKISNDLLELIYLLDPEYLSFNSLYSGALKLNTSTQTLIRSGGNSTLESLVENFKLKNLKNLDVESFSEMMIYHQHTEQAEQVENKNQFYLTINQLKESIINNKSIKSLSIKINKDLSKFWNIKLSIDQDVEIIDFFSTTFKLNSTIKSLTLSGFNFLKFIPNFFESLKFNQSIQSLSLTNGSLVNNSQFELLYNVLSINSRIQYLNIQNNRILLNEDTIKKFIKLNSLKTLKLSNNTFDKIVIKHFNENPLFDLII